MMPTDFKEPSDEWMKTDELCDKGHTVEIHIHTELSLSYATGKRCLQCGWVTGEEAWDDGESVNS